jgi:hypothetical protein
VRASDFRLFPDTGNIAASHELTRSAKERQSPNITGGSLRRSLT